jgi:hypothetical protein
MNSSADLSATTLSATTTTHKIERPRTAVYFWIALVLVGLVMIGFGVAGSYYTNVIDAPYVGP